MWRPPSMVQKLPWSSTLRCHSNYTIVNWANTHPYLIASHYLMLFLYFFVSVLVQETKRAEAALNELRRSYETDVCELQCKIQRMKLVNISLHFHYNTTSTLWVNTDSCVHVYHPLTALVDSAQLWIFVISTLFKWIMNTKKIIRSILHLIYHRQYKQKFHRG